MTFQNPGSPRVTIEEIHSMRHLARADRARRIAEQIVNTLVGTNLSADQITDAVEEGEPDCDLILAALRCPAGL